MQTLGAGCTQDNMHSSQSIAVYSIQMYSDLQPGDKDGM